jgi:hypothetical protein
MSETSWSDDTWCLYLPGLHRTLADESLREAVLPRSFISLDFHQSCAWWETLRYLFRALLGWHNLPAGLAWWYQAGKPALDDPCLALVRQRWDTRQELDFFAAREWEAQGFCGWGSDEQKIWPAGYEPCPGWWREFKAREPLAEHSPYGGGWNPLHLGHSDCVGEQRPVGLGTGFHDLAARRAVLIVNGFGSWRRELRDFGTSLPNLGGRSWRVEVFDRHVGFLGVFRQSRETRLWFQGKHSIHLAGNVSHHTP